MKKKEAILTVEDLRVHLPVRPAGLWSRPTLAKIVDGLSFEIRQEQTLGLVGETGCGKTTLAKSLIRLKDPSSGTIRYRNRDITKLGTKKLRPLRRHFQMVFQDPVEGLSPRASVGEIIAEPLCIQKMGKRWQKGARVTEVLDLVGLPKNSIHKYPADLSSGQKQRVAIARALVTKPELLILDEPFSTLDVSVQAQLMNLLLNLQDELKMSYLFISHDLAVVKHMSDLVAVMYLGKIVEMAPAEVIYQHPLHAYTKTLLAAIPAPDPYTAQERVILASEIPDPARPPAGCPYGHRVGHPRYEESLSMDHLPFEEVSPGHWVKVCPCCVD